MEKNIYLLGDIGYYNEHTYNIFKSINHDSKKGDCLVLLGDNFYPSGVISENGKSWENIRKAKIKIPIFPILGNHDYLLNPYAQIRHTSDDYKWSFPYFYYKVTVNNYDLFLIDTCILQPNYSNITEDIMNKKIVNYENERIEMIKWLEHELKKSKNKKIVIGHYPIISLGIYGVNNDLFSMLIDLFEKYNVLAYISGHDHNLQIHSVKNNCSNYQLKHMVSGSGSGIYNYSSFKLEDDNKNIFYKNGFIKLVTNQKEEKLKILIMDEYCNVVHSELL